MLFEAQVRDQALQSGILVPELPALPQLRDPKPLELMLAPVEGPIRNPQLLADLWDLCPVLHLLQREDNLIPVPPMILAMIRPAPKQTRA